MSQCEGARCTDAQVPQAPDDCQGPGGPRRDRAGLRLSQHPGVWHTAGSVAAVAEGPGRHTLVFCNNYANNVTRHTLHDDGRITGSRVLLQRGLETPDGVSVSPDRRWLAVSNHDMRSVFVYAFDPELGPDSEPQAVLRGFQYPHGLRFTAGARHIVVADAGAPLVHVFCPGPDGCWYGTRFPSLSCRVMSDEAFLRGRHIPEEGGTKGLDIAPGQPALAVTSEHQSLAFRDLGPQLDLSEAYAAINCGEPRGHAMRYPSPEVP